MSRTAHSTMNRKKRTIILLVLFWSVVIGTSGLWYWRADRQERLNRGLIAAIKREDSQAALVALEQGADANTRDEPRASAWLKVLNMLRGRHSAPSKGPTPLILLASRDVEIPDKESTELVGALLARGAYINKTDQEGYSPLFYALIGGRRDLARLLIEQGANVNGEPSDRNLLAIEILYTQDRDLAELMLQRGADVDRVSRRDGSAFCWSPMFTALVVEDSSIVRLLLQNCADPNQTVMRRPKALPPLEYAEQHHLTEIARLLRDAGAKR